MKISLKEWVIFIVLAIISFSIWLAIGYSQFKNIDLSIDRREALKRAQSYLTSIGVKQDEFSSAIVFYTDDATDRYLQKTLKLKEDAFIRENKYELFFWQIRFFKKFSKEEYVFGISPQTGEIIAYSHSIDDIEARPYMEKELAKKKVEEFLKETFKLDMNEYIFHEEKVSRLEKRVDYSFFWEKKGVYIPWQKDQGGAKLLMGGIISGEEIRGYYKGTLDIPEKFDRYIENQLSSGLYYAGFSRFAMLGFLVYSVFLVINRRYDSAIRVSKKWYISLAIFLGVLSVLYLVNNSQNLIFNYSTSSSFGSYIGSQVQSALVNILFFSVLFIMPAYAGESLRQEVMPHKQQASFFYYLRTTFASRSVASSILLGYLVFLIILGLQTLIFHLGQEYLGVWKEWMHLTQFSAAYIPFAGALIISMNASFGEEIIFRIFGLSFAKKFLKNTALAIVVIAVCWAVGHSGYAIFPFWFRVLEVTIIGVLFGTLFFKYGIIVLIVAHYLMDAFLSCAPYILGKSLPFLFWGSAGVLLLPLILALAAYFRNKPEIFRAPEFLFDDNQMYNLGILKAYVSLMKSKGALPGQIKEELLRHNWDSLIVETAIDQVFPDKEKPANEQG